MNIFKGCLKQLEDTSDCEDVTGLIMLHDWYPFSYSAMLLDFNDIVETNLIKCGCVFLVGNGYFELLSDKRYVFKIIKFSKFNQFNINKIACVIKNSLGDVLAAGGRDYVAQINRINTFINEEL